VSGDGNANPSTEADHDVTISKPTVRCDVSVYMLESQLDWIIGIVYVE